MESNKSLAELKKDFSDALALFLTGDGEVTDRSELFYGHTRLLYSAKKDPEILKFVFSSLLVALDNAPDGEPSVQKTILRFLDGGTLHKLPLQIALGQYRP